MTRRRRTPGSAGSGRPRVLLIVENVALARDHRLRKQVATLASHGYSVTVICRSDPGNCAQPGVSLHEYRSPKDGSTRLGFLREYAHSWTLAALLTLKVFVTEGFDAVQISGTPDIYFAIGAPFKLLGRSLVLDQRDLSPELYEIRYGTSHGLVHRILCRLELASFRAADHVITVNASLEQTALARGCLRPETVTVVGNGPVLARTHRRAATPALKQGRPLLCCWVGMMGPQDRVEVAVRAVGHLVHVIKRTDCHFAFVGEGDARAPSQQLAEAIGVSEWVSFPGWAEEDEVFAYLSTADLGLEPNLEEIVSPVKGMEYMAFELPFVAFDLKETRAVAGDAAAYAAPGDVEGFATLLDELLADPARRASMGRTGRRLVEERLAWDRQEEAYTEVYARLLPARRRERQRQSHRRSPSAV